MLDQELTDMQYQAAIRYVQGIRDHYLVVDWRSIRFYASLFTGSSEAIEDAASDRRTRA